MENTAAYRDARRHVERKIRFCIHFAVFMLVNGGLILLHVLQARGTAWTPWPLFGWGIGLLFHGLHVFLRAPGARWKQRMIENELNRRTVHKSPAS